MICWLRHLIGWTVNGFRSREDLLLENLALRQQLLALHTQRPRRRLSTAHKLFWVVLRGLWSGWKRPLVLVTPKTVVAWHRAGFRLYWRWLSRARRVGGRKRMSLEVRSLIFRSFVWHPVRSLITYHAFGRSAYGSSLRRPLRAPASNEVRENNPTQTKTSRGWPVRPPTSDGDNFCERRIAIVDMVTVFPRGTRHTHYRGTGPLLALAPRRKCTVRFFPKQCVAVSIAMMVFPGGMHATFSRTMIVSPSVPGLLTTS